MGVSFYEAVISHLLPPWRVGLRDPGLARPSSSAYGGVALELFSFRFEGLSSSETIHKFLSATLLYGHWPAETTQTQMGVAVVSLDDVRSTMEAGA